MEELMLYCYGVKVLVSSNSKDVLEQLAENFYFFKSQSAMPVSSSLELKILKEDPPYARVPPVEASIHDIGSITYKQGSITYTDYSNQGLMIYDFNKELCEIFSQDAYLLYEKAKLTILTRLGEHWDRDGFHRLHAVGLSKNNRGLVCLLPIEGGKTTITMNVLKADPTIGLISDDMCLVDKKGNLYPFVMHIGLRDVGLAQGIATEQIREINSPKYGRKWMIKASFFSQRLAMGSRLKYLLIGKRAFQDKSEVRAISRAELTVALIEATVIGSGLPRLKEFFFRGGLRVSLKRFQAVCSRSASFFTLIWRAQAYQLRIGRDKDHTAQVIIDFFNAKDLRK